MSKILFEIEGAQAVAIECNPGDNLLELARRGNVAIDAPCSGNGVCGKCRVRLVSGELDAPINRHISQMVTTRISTTNSPWLTAIV